MGLQRLLIFQSFRTKVTSGSTGSFMNKSNVPSASVSMIKLLSTKRTAELSPALHNVLIIGAFEGILALT